MEYFYTPPELIEPAELTIADEEFAHLTHVMRKEPGDAIRVVDGVGTAYDVTIEEITQRSARCSISARYVGLNEPARTVVVAAALLKNSAKFDYLVEKVTELGAAGIIPLRTERTIPLHARTERWQKIALAAMKQSGRCMLPTVHPTILFGDLLRKSESGLLRIISHEKTECPRLSEAIKTETMAVQVWIGPEGGFSEKEIQLAVSAGLVPVSLGPRRLRTETAAMLSVALVLGEA
jgi:16S rRNA (uracil1498-N3)-methyltransferase